MKRDKVYISGPISSRPLDLAIHHFTLAEIKLQAQGYRTCNPLKMRLCVWLARHGHYRLCLWIQLLWMSATCQCIYLLDGWHTSDGARAERAVARVMGIVAMYERPLRRTASAVSKTAEAFAELGKAVAACGVNDKTIKPKSKKHKKAK
jgi:hypothetical protein